MALDNCQRFIYLEVKEPVPTTVSLFFQKGAYGFGNLSVDCSIEGVSGE